MNFGQVFLQPIRKVSGSLNPGSRPVMQTPPSASVSPLTSPCRNRTQRAIQEMMLLWQLLLLWVICLPCLDSGVCALCQKLETGEAKYLLTFSSRLPKRRDWGAKSWRLHRVHLSNGKESCFRWKEWCAYSIFLKSRSDFPGTLLTPHSASTTLRVSSSYIIPLTVWDT